MSLLAEILSKILKTFKNSAPGSCPGERGLGVVQAGGDGWFPWRCG